MGLCFVYFSWSMVYPYIFCCRLLHVVCCSHASNNFHLSSVEAKNTSKTFRHETFKATFAKKSSFLTFDENLHNPPKRHIQISSVASGRTNLALLVAGPMCIQTLRGKLCGREVAQLQVQIRRFWKEKLRRKKCKIEKGWSFGQGWHVDAYWGMLKINIFWSAEPQQWRLPWFFVEKLTRTVQVCFAQESVTEVFKSSFSWLPEFQQKMQRVYLGMFSK